jgi:hypothetical protein
MITFPTGHQTTLLQAAGSYFIATCNTILFSSFSFACEANTFYHVAKPMYLHTTQN